MTDEIDELVRTAAKAHEALAPAGYADALEQRVLARIASGEAVDLPEAVMMSDPDNDAVRNRSNPPPDGPPQGDSEDSGLHDIRTLAHTAKLRISKRITSQHDAIDESLSSSSSGLRAVALPEPARLVSLPELPVAAKGTAASAAVVGDGAGASVTPIGASKKKTGLYVAIGGGLLAAAAAAVIVIGGGTKQGDGGDAPGAASGTGGEAAIAVEQDKSGAAPALAAVPATAVGTAAGTGAGTAMADDTGANTAVADGKAEGRGDRVATGEPSATADKDAADPAKKVKEAPKTDAPAKPEKAVVGDKVKGADKGKPAGGTAAGAGASGGDKSIEDLLNEASGGPQKPADGTGGGAGGGGPAAPEKTGLDGKDIKKGMSAVAGQAQACFDNYGVAGHVKIKAIVDSSGAVTRVDATGEFAGTPTGTCVANAAKGASFPSWTGGPMTVTYAFTLQE